MKSIHFAAALVASAAIATPSFAQSLAAPSGHSYSPAVATPESVLGFLPGEDNKLDSWADLKQFYEALAKTSDRVRVQNLGKTTEGRPYLAAIFSSPENIRQLKRLQEQNAKLSDPRKLKGGDSEAEQLIKTGKAVVVITCGIHSNEVASYLGGQLIAYRLAAANDAETNQILENTIVVLVPALNPDGVDIVKEQFDKTLTATATATGARRAGGANSLYHKYIGHDDNRDWVGFTQAETLISVEKVINPWHPQVLHDIHQQGSNGPRLTLPPYTAPVEPNIPPQLVTGYTELGRAIADDLTKQGLPGVISGAETATGYDAWSPLRQYAHFHNAVRILQESASARIAAPITVDPERVRPNTPLPNAPLPWKGGAWHVGDATKYVTAAAFSLLNHVSTDREKWLRTAYQIAKEAVRTRHTGEVSAWLLPPTQNRAALLSILNSGGVETETLQQPYEYMGTRYPKGTAVVRLDQPFGGFANAVLSVQHYPDLLDAKGHPIRPYDVTAHTLPFLFNTPAVAVEGPIEFQARLARPARHVVVRVAERSPVKGVRLALLKSNTIDEGWTRWVLEKNHVPYTLLDASQVKPGDLSKQFDTILLPTAFGGGGRGAAIGGDADLGTGSLYVLQNPTQPSGGSRRQANSADSTELIAEVRRFAEGGGTVVAINRASNSLITGLSLPIKDVTQGLGRNEFFVPGSILQADLTAGNPVTKGLGEHSIIWAENSPAFDVDANTPAGQVEVLARYGTQADPLLSGWLLGGDKIKGKAALVDVRLGKGHVVLFGFVPHYRGISLATYPLLFNAINLGRNKD